MYIKQNKNRSTLRQKNLANEIVLNSKRAKPLNKSELLEKVGYTKTQAKKKPGETIAQKGVQEELKALGFDEYSARKVVEEIMLNDKVKPNDRLKATDQVFKVVGAYSPEEHNIYASYTREQLIERLMSKFQKK
ncbi:MAG TPA: hypothetical protein VJG67_00765 [Candidatus Paceibacterota bacterium]